MHRPLDKKSGERKRDSDLNQSERATLRQQKEKAEWLRRNGKSRDDRK